MNMKINLTADEMTEVLDAIEDAAIRQGWDEDDFDAEEVGYDLLADLVEIVNAALAAMGIEVVEEEDDDFDEDEDEDDLDLDEDWDDDEYEDEDEEEDDDEYPNPLGLNIINFHGKRSLSYEDGIDLLSTIARQVEEVIPDETAKRKWEVTVGTFYEICEEAGIYGVLKEEAGE